MWLYLNIFPTSLCRLHSPHFLQEIHFLVLTVVYILRSISKYLPRLTHRTVDGFYVQCLISSTLIHTQLSIFALAIQPSVADASCSLAKTCATDAPNGRRIRMAAMIRTLMHYLQQVNSSLFSSCWLSMEQKMTFNRAGPHQSCVRTFGGVITVSETIVDLFTFSVKILIVVTDPT